MSTGRARIAAASKLQQMAATTDEDSEIYESDEAESMLSDEQGDQECEPEQEMVKKGEPPAKRAKVASPRKQAATPVEAPLRRGKKSLSLLPTMPIDVLFEILGLLTPKDLLNVSQTNKLFRETLLSSGAKTVWKYALRAQEAPECPSDLTESRWTSLLFGSRCESCGAPNVHKVDFYLRRRVCIKCKKMNLLIKSKVGKFFPDYNEAILNLVPTTNVGGSAHGHSSSSQYFWRSDIEKMIHTLASYEQKKNMRLPGAQDELTAFIQQRMTQVFEIQSTANKFQAWFINAALERSTATYDAKRDRLEAIRAKFLELGYEESDLSMLRYAKECDQKAALTDAIWKRIRPKLEPDIQKRKEERIERIMRDKRRTRQGLLAGVYTDYQASVSPLQWKYLPNVVELSEKEPFKGIINSAHDATITAADFTLLTPKFPEVITEIQDELKTNLVQQLTYYILESDQVVPPNCLDLATSVFSCRGPCGSASYVVGADDIISHNCEAVYVNSYYYESPYGQGAAATKRNFVVSRLISAVARSLVLCAGLNPEKALAAEMDSNDLRFACNACKHGKPFGYSWRNALSHYGTSHFALMNPNKQNWRILSPAETALLKQNEEKDLKWTKSQWACSHCPISLRHRSERGTIIEHIRTNHEIVSPTVPTDMFYFEKTVSPFSQPDTILYAVPPPPPPRPGNVKNIICLSCASGHRDRHFNITGVVAHLKAKHSINNPKIGVHYKRKGAPS